ncbi:hypothetical protein, partial [Morganella morganii]
VDDILGSQFPLNINNDGNSIKVYINDIKDSVVSVEATYLSKRCTTAHLNAAYTKISYSSDKISVDIDNIENRDGITIFTAPINGGGWCNWELITVVIKPIPRENKATASTSIAIDVVDTDINYILYDILLAPVVRQESNKKDEFYYRISKVGDNKISKNKSGEVYINAKLKSELLTYSLMDERVVIFPNGVKKDYRGSRKLIFPDFYEIMENSILKDEMITEK